MRKVTFLLAAFLAAILLSVPAISRAQQETQKEKPKTDAMADCPLHAEHMRNSKSGSSAHSQPPDSSLETRGNAAMGFEQSKTTHHFLLKPDGGVILVQANDPNDTVSREQIRKHFHRIAAAFAAGDFQIPMMVHDTLPPGASAMKRLREKIQYIYEETSTGARVVIRTADTAALDAIHDFLRYQIHEHETGDPDNLR